MEVSFSEGLFLLPKGYVFMGCIVFPVWHSISVIDCIKLRQLFSVSMQLLHILSSQIKVIESEEISGKKCLLNLNWRKLDANSALSIPEQNKFICCPHLGEETTQTCQSCYISLMENFRFDYQCHRPPPLRQFAKGIRKLAPIEKIMLICLQTASFNEG